MKWQQKHDIILDWIDSCKTFEQLTNVVHFIMKQTFDKGSLIWFAEQKGRLIQMDMICDGLSKLVKR